MVIKASTLEALVVNLKSERSHQMQTRAGVGTEADHVTRIRGDFGLHKNDINHRRHFATCAAYEQRLTPLLPQHPH
jgi:hypothetical protein